MSRVKTGVTRRHRHKKVLKANKGFRGTNNRLYKRAHEAFMHAGMYAYIGRKLRKRDMRSLWITRIGAAVRQADPTLSYSVFIKKLKDANVMINRKMLSELAIADFTAFTNLVKQVRG